MNLDLTLTRWQRLLRALGFAWRRVESCDHPAERARNHMDPDLHVVCLDCGAFLFFAFLGLTREGERSAWNQKGVHP